MNRIQPGRTGTAVFARGAARRGLAFLGRVVAVVAWVGGGACVVLFLFGEGGN